MSSAPTPPSRPHRIVVVDDEELIRWSIERHLSDAGHQVTALGSGEELVRHLAELEPDLVLLDVRLPGMSGLEVLDFVHAERPDVPVIMLTAFGSVDLAVEAMRQGATDFLSKPFDLPVLEQRIARNLDAVRLRREVAVVPAAEPGVARTSSKLVGDSPAMRELCAMVDRVGRSDASSVLIQGESGTGKEVVARCLHLASRRADKPFITVNCTTLPESLVESELFGHERGAFTDARERKAGLVELADGGTLFLDEIGDMPLSAQAKLLRVVENRSFTRVGGTSERKVDIRIVTATHRDLLQSVNAERFRQDLYFRLNVINLVVPPLRERVTDVVALSAHFVALFNLELKRRIRGVSREALELMCAHDWPGNVRELRNVIERGFVLAGGDEILVEHLPPQLRRSARPAGTPSSGPTAPVGSAPVGSAPAMPAQSAPPHALHHQSPAATLDTLDLSQIEEQTLKSALERAGGNQSQAARLLGIGRDGLRYRMKKLGLL